MAGNAGAAAYSKDCAAAQRMLTQPKQIRFVYAQNQVGSCSNIGNDRGRNVKLGLVLSAVAGKNVDSLGAHRVGQFDIRRVIANDKGSAEIDSVSALRNLRKKRFWLHALTLIRSLMWAAIHRSDTNPFLSQGSHDMIIDGARFIHAQTPLSNSALVRHDKEDEAFKPAQGGKRLRVEGYLTGVSKKSSVFNQSAIAVKKDGRLLH